MINLDQIRNLFIGLETKYPTRLGTNIRQCYLDSTASSLAFLPSVNFINDYLKYYANVHSDRALLHK